MRLELSKLPSETRQWPGERGQMRGPSMDVEAFVILEDAFHDRVRRQRLFFAAANPRIRIPGPPVTAEEIEKSINRGRIP